MYPEDSKIFRLEALTTGRVFPDPLYFPTATLEGIGPAYFFDLNQGRLVTSQELPKVWELVKLARKYGDTDDYGEHIALLRQVARKSELSQERVDWYRPERVSASKNPAEWKSLQSLLEENRFDLREVYGKTYYPSNTPQTI